MSRDDGATRPFRALVTGSSRGIGAAVARRLTADGAHVVLHGRDGARLDALARELSAEALAVDLLDPSGPTVLAGRAGGIDVLVHCAGIGWRGELARMDPLEADHLLTLNLRAPIALTCALLPGMLARDRGHITFVSSIAGLTGVAREAVYSASKAGLIAFADSLALELAASRIGVSVIAPGAVDTEFWAARGSAYQRRFPRPISAERVAELIVRDVRCRSRARVVPRWLAVAPAVRGVAPATYRRLARRFG